MKYLSNLNLNKNELQNARIQNLAAAPANPVAGQIYFNTGSGQAFIWSGSAWLSAAGATVVAGNGIDVDLDGQQYTVSHEDTSSQASLSSLTGANVVESITLDTYGHITGITTRTLDLVIGAAADSGSGSFDNTDTLSIVGGNVISTAWDNDTKTFSIGHDNVSRTDTTSTASPAFAGTFDVIDGITTSAQGHVTAANVKTVTLPTYNVSAVDVSSVAKVRLNSGAANDDIALVGGTDIEVVVTDADTITFNHADTSSQTSVSGLSGASVISEVSIDGRGHVTTLATRSLTPSDIDALDAGNLSVSGSTISSTDATITIDPSTAGAGGTVIIAGDLTVQGTTTTVNSTTIELGDNIIVLNNGEDGTPSANAGFEVERGTSDNVSFLWNETNDRFEITDANETYVVGRKYVHTIGTVDLTGATATITHNLNTKDVFVSLREADTDEIVYATYDAATLDTLEVKFAVAPADGAYIVTIIG
jgi:hypothetical protein